MASYKIQVSKSVKQKSPAKIGMAVKKSMRKAVGAPIRIGARGS